MSTRCKVTCEQCHGEGYWYSDDPPKKPSYLGSIFMLSLTLPVFLAPLFLLPALRLWDSPSMAMVLVTIMWLILWVPLCANYDIPKRVVSALRNPQKVLSDWLDESDDQVSPPTSRYLSNVFARPEPEMIQQENTLPK